MHEWPVLIFSFLLQASVGLTVALSLQFIVARSWFLAKEQENLLKVVLITPALLGALALAASFAHLGYPWNAPNAIKHFMTSWMSREIITVSAYIALACLVAFSVLLDQIASVKIFSFLKVFSFLKKYTFFLLLLSALMGIIAVFCSGELYRATTVATWMSLYTHASFFSSVFVIGGALSFFIVLTNFNKLPTSTLRRNLTLISLMMIFAGILVLILSAPIFFSGMIQSVESGVLTLPHRPIETYFSLETMRSVRWALTSLGVLIFVTALWKQEESFQASYKSLLLISIGFLILGEWYSKYMFFAIG